ncbi:hypothetical protein ACS0TY_035896 [Phlomoides rotata]
MDSNRFMHSTLDLVGASPSSSIPGMVDRCSHGEPKVLLYDEPTAVLDPIASTIVEDLIRSVHLKGEDALGNTGKIASYVVVTHQHSTIRSDWFSYFGNRLLSFGFNFSLQLLLYLIL